MGQKSGSRAANSPRAKLEEVGLLKPLGLAGTVANDVANADTAGGGTAQL